MCQARGRSIENCKAVLHITRFNHVHAPHSPDPPPPAQLWHLQHLVDEARSEGVTRTGGVGYTDLGHNMGRGGSQQQTLVRGHHHIYVDGTALLTIVIYQAHSTCTPHLLQSPTSNAGTTPLCSALVGLRKE